MENNLHYNITDWHQLVQVKSNNSRDLSIKVADIIQNDILQGLRIQVCHKTYGVLFVYILNARGSIVTNPSEGTPFELSTSEILSELAKWGFDVTYEVVKYLPQSQLAYLSTLLALNYDKLRVLGVRGNRNAEALTAKPYLVVFNIEQNPDWINNSYIATQSEFDRALQEGSAINISNTGTANAWDWSWLNFVANIEDILSQNHYGE